MSVIAFDTQVLIWGVQGIARPGQKGMIARAQAYFELLGQRKDKVIVPLPAAMEYVCGFPISLQSMQWPVLSKKFKLVPFDLRAAMIASEIEWTRMERSRPANKLPKSKHSPSKVELAELTRQQIKVDVQILAIAIAAGATEIVTHDIAHFSSFSQGYEIQVHDIPSLTMQPPLPFPDDE